MWRSERHECPRRKQPAWISWNPWNSSDIVTSFPWFLQYIFYLKCQRMTDNMRELYNFHSKGHNATKNLKKWAEPLGHRMVFIPMIGHLLHIPIKNISPKVSWQKFDCFHKLQRAYIIRPITLFSSTSDEFGKYTWRKFPKGTIEPSEIHGDSRVGICFQDK